MFPVQLWFHYPAQVSLERKLGGGHKCGGSLISRSPPAPYARLHVLTAAHCVIMPGFEVWRSPGIAEVVVGLHDKE